MDSALSVRRISIVVRIFNPQAEAINTKFDSIAAKFKWSSGLESSITLESTKAQYAKHQ